MKDILYKVLTVLNLVLLCVCLLGCVYVVGFDTDIANIVDAVIEVIAVLAALEYFARGAKKDAARYYKMFLIFEAATFVLEELVNIFVESFYISPVSELFTMLLFGVTILLAFGKDLGKKVTLSLVGFNLLVYACVMIHAFVNGSFENPFSLIMTTTWFSTASITMVMAIAKYRDKADRHRKQ